MSHQNLSGQCLLWAESCTPLLLALVTALGVSALTDIRAKKPLLYIITGAMICGIVALAVSLMLKHFALPPGSGAFVGAVVGFTGADRLRKIALILILRRTGINKKDK